MCYQIWGSRLDKNCLRTVKPALRTVQRFRPPKKIGLSGMHLGGAFLIWRVNQRTLKMTYPGQHPPLNGLYRLA